MTWHPDVTDPDFASYWEGTRAGELRATQCVECGRHCWPPRAGCRHCGGLDFQWVAVPARATVFTWTVVHHKTVPWLEPPYVVGLVELEPAIGVRYLGHLVGVDPERLEIGMPVHAVFRPASSDPADHLVLVDWELDQQ